MIQALDDLLRHLFRSEIPAIGEEENQVRFQPPDEKWRTAVSNLQLGNNALNVYLVELRENRRLRSNERVRVVADGMVHETPAPARVDCHYLITAWSHAADAGDVEPTRDEHSLLYQVTRVLMRHERLVPSEIYSFAGLPANFPPQLATAEGLPAVILPVEGFPKYAEFWGTMGAVHPWKPAIYLIVTVPVVAPTELVGPMVTTRLAEFRHSGMLESAEAWVQIGGHLLDATAGSPVPIRGGWVRLETLNNIALHTTLTDEHGRFTFGALHPNHYRLRSVASGLGEKTRDITVPTETGEYDLQFP